MRLWHIDILPYLPKSQLLAQKRECDLIWRDYKNGKQTNHILINYIHKYNANNFHSYYCELAHEFVIRNFKFKDNSPLIIKYSPAIIKFDLVKQPFKEHNNEYLLICFMNLYEKYIRGQKDFDKATFNKLYDFVNTKFDLKSLGIEKE